MNAMKKLRVLLLLLAACPAPGVPGVAQATFTCLSPRFQTGWDQNHLYSLDLTTTDPSGPANGELAPDNSGAYSHSSWFLLRDPSGFDPAVGSIGLDVPYTADANDNGFYDFFEVAQPVSGTTSGSYSIPGVINNGTVSATWNRAAGSSRGTCVLNFQGYGKFTHTFDITEYRGPLPYTPGSPKVLASMDLPQTGSPENRIGGELEFVKDALDPFNTLHLSSGSLTNSAMETLGFYQATFLRDIQWPTNYYSLVELDNDGDINTYYPYGLYLLSIDDPNDADNDKIPDFSDTVTVQPPRRPSLKLVYSAGTLSLTISGDVGRSHRIEQAQTWPPTPAGWSAVQTVTLTNDPQVLTLTLPQSPPAFWRVVAQ